MNDPLEDYGHDSHMPAQKQDPATTGPRVRGRLEAFWLSRDILTLFLDKIVFTAIIVLLGFWINVKLETLKTENSKTMADRDLKNMVALENIRSSLTATNAAIAEQMRATNQNIADQNKYTLDLQKESNRRFNELRTQTYVDFIRSVAGLAISQSRQDEKAINKYMVMLTDAKARIAMYGDKDVARFTSHFFQTYSALNTPSALREFAILVEKMRESDKNVDAPLILNDIGGLLFSEVLD